MQNFYLPDFYHMNAYKVNKYIIDLVRSGSEKCREGINIAAIYGAFPGQIWNGGRYFGYTNGNPTPKWEIHNTIDLYNGINIPMRFTYTNSLIEEKHLHDAYCNKITDAAHNGKNEILVNSPILEGYLRSKYPNYKFISSTTKCLLNKDEIVKEADNYYLVVLDYRLNKNFDFLSSLPNPEKYEILIDPFCDTNCTRRKEHYELIAAGQLSGSYNDTVMHTEGCEYCGGFMLAKEKGRAFMSLEDLAKLEEMGFQHFKLEGRYYPMVDVIESYVYYFIKPEYRDEIRYNLLKLAYSN